MDPGSLFLLFLVLVIGGGVVVAALMMLGVIGKGNKNEAERQERFGRPEHERVTSETIENTEMVGTGRDDDATRR